MASVKQKILIIDDCPENISVLSEMLKDEYRTIAALSGKNGYDLAASDNPPDLILLDVIMDGMDGFEVCEKLRNNISTEHIPVIFITGQHDVDSEVRGLELGAVDYITKPFNPRLIKSRIKTHLYVKQYQSNLEMLIDMNVAELRRKSNENQNTASLYKTLLDSIEDSVFLINKEGLIELANPSVVGMFGYQPDELIGQSIEMLVPSCYSDHVAKRNGFLHHDSGMTINRNEQNISDNSNALDIAKTQDDDFNQLPGKLVAKRKDGAEFPVSITLAELEINGERKVTAVVHDLTERKRWEEKLSHMALTDTLTGLANRRQLENKIEYVSKLTDRMGTGFAVILLDLDKFKPINDTYGHQVGDEVLKRTARVLNELVRETDTVARLGGDEFVLVCVGSVTADNIMMLSRRIVKALAQPFDSGGHSISVGCSIGIFMARGEQLNVDEMLHRADLALYKSKNNGRNMVTLHHEEYSRVESLV